MDTIEKIISLISIILIIFAVVKLFELDESTQKIQVKRDTFITVQKRKNENPAIAKKIAIQLNIVREKGNQIVNYCYKNNLPNKTVADRLYKRWSKITSKKNGIRETAAGEKSAAYVLNKGDQLRMCVRKRNDPTKLEDSNTMIFVLLHELAHLMCVKYGHGREFQDHFAYITRKAVEQGIYRYQNFSENSSSYCGTKITNDAY